MGRGKKGRGGGGLSGPSLPPGVYRQYTGRRRYKKAGKDGRVPSDPLILFLLLAIVVTFILGVFYDRLTQSGSKLAELLISGGLTLIFCLGLLVFGLMIIRLVKYSGKLFGDFKVESRRPQRPSPPPEPEPNEQGTLTPEEASENAMRRANFTPETNLARLTDVGVLVYKPHQRIPDVFRIRNMPLGTAKVRPFAVIAVPEDSPVLDQTVSFDFLDNTDTRQFSCDGDGQLVRGKVSITAKQRFIVENLGGRWTVQIRVGERVIGIHRIDLVGTTYLSPDGEVSNRLARELEDDEDSGISLSELLDEQSMRKDERL
jgi:hypothetical protein